MKSFTENQNSTSITNSNIKEDVNEFILNQILKEKIIMFDRLSIRQLKKYVISKVIMENVVLLENELIINLCDELNLDSKVIEIFTDIEQKMAYKIKIIEEELNFKFLKFNESLKDDINIDNTENIFSSNIKIEDVIGKCNEYISSKLYPNGIMNGEIYNYKVVKDCISLFLETYTHSQMVKEQQNEVIKQLCGLCITQKKEKLFEKIK